MKPDPERRRRKNWGFSFLQSMRRPCNGHVLSAVVSQNCLSLFCLDCCVCLKRAQSRPPATHETTRPDCYFGFLEFCPSNSTTLPLIGIVVRWLDEIWFLEEEEVPIYLPHELLKYNSQNDRRWREVFLLWRKEQWIEMVKKMFWFMTTGGGALSSTAGPSSFRLL